MNFTNALALMENGFRCTRKAWRDAYPNANVWIGMVHASQPITIYNMPKHWLNSGKNGARIEFQDWIGIKDANDAFYPWDAAQCDVLANDWAIVDVSLPEVTANATIDVAIVEPVQEQVIKPNPAPVIAQKDVEQKQQEVKTEAPAQAPARERFSARRNRLK